MTRMRWLQLVLVISLAINLLVAGALVGRLRDREPPLGWAVQQLDPETRAVLRPLMRQRIGTTFKMRRAMRSAQGRIRDIIEQEPLDEQALALELAQLREISVRYQASMHETAIDVLAELTPEQRLRVARRLLTPPGDRRPPGADHRPPGPGDRPGPPPGGKRPTE